MFGSSTCPRHTGPTCEFCGGSGFITYSSFEEYAAKMGRAFGTPCPVREIPPTEVNAAEQAMTRPLHDRLDAQYKRLLDASGLLRECLTALDDHTVLGRTMRDKIERFLEVK